MNKEFSIIKLQSIFRMKNGNNALYSYTFDGIKEYLMIVDLISMHSVTQTSDCFVKNVHIIRTCYCIYIHHICPIFWLLYLLFCRFWAISSECVVPMSMSSPSMHTYMHKIYARMLIYSHVHYSCVVQWTKLNGCAADEKPKPLPMFERPRIVFMLPKYSTHSVRN